MLEKIINDIPPLIRLCTLPGGAGGIVWFLLAYKRGHYRNNKYTAKFSVETIGAMITATFIGILFIQARYQVQIAASFAIGIGWSGIIQIVRTKITKIVEAALGEKISGGAS